MFKRYKEYREIKRRTREDVITNLATRRAEDGLELETTRARACCWRAMAHLKAAYEHAITADTDPTTIERVHADVARCALALMPDTRPPTEAGPAPGALGPAAKWSPSQRDIEDLERAECPF